jgi:hypothetical protein
MTIRVLNHDLTTTTVVSAPPPKAELVTTLRWFRSDYPARFDATLT